jgi:hypothetical protein
VRVRRVRGRRSILVRRGGRLGCIFSLRANDAFCILDNKGWFCCGWPARVFGMFSVFWAGFFVELFFSDTIYRIGCFLLVQIVYAGVLAIRSRRLMTRVYYLLTANVLGPSFTSLLML